MDSLQFHSGVEAGAGCPNDQACFMCVADNLHFGNYLLQLLAESVIGLGAHGEQDVVVGTHLDLSTVGLLNEYWMLRRLFAVLTKCESPFCCEVVNRMRSFGFSLLPVAAFASIGETMLESFLTAGKSTNVSIQWGILIAFVVTMSLVAVFKYGVQLQKESDETL